MSQSTNSSNASKALLLALRDALTAAMANVDAALDHDQAGEPNGVIGALASFKPTLDEAVELYQAILAIHRLNRRNSSS